MEILRLSSSELEQYMKCLKTVFQDARLLDANCTDYRMVNKEGKLGEHMYNCFKIWNRNSRCENCISRKVFQEKTIAHKFELLDDEIFIVFAKYIEVDGEGRVLEMLCHVTNDMIKNGDVDFPIREAIKHTNREIYEDVQLKIYNRRYYEEQTLTLEDITAAAFIDIDYFKAINDQYGHSVGDEVLLKVANSLKSQVRENDIVIRYGGDEFVILFHKIPAEILKNRLLVIKNNIKKLKIDEHPEIEFSISIGGCSFSEFSHKIVDLADSQMYLVKHNPDEVAVVHVG